jgi:hypothetical protein
MDEFLKSIYPYARTPQERMMECNIDLLKMANEIPCAEFTAPMANQISCSEFTAPMAINEDELFSESLDPCVRDELSGGYAQCGNMPLELEGPYLPSHYLVPPALEVDWTCATDYSFLHADSGMESISSAMDSPSDYTSSSYPTPTKLQTLGTYAGNSLSVDSGSSQPSPASANPLPTAEHQPSCVPQHKVSSAEQAEALAPLIMVLNAKNMSTVAQRTRAKYTPAKRKEVHNTRKRGACRECRRRKKKVSIQVQRRVWVW